MKSVFIIAEAGVNHNGDITQAFKLIDVAKDSAADAVKFQTIISPEANISKYALKASYQIENTGSDEKQIDMIRQLFIRHEQFVEIKKYCDEKQILFLSTPFDVESVYFLNELGLDIFKIPSGEITNLPYLRAIGKLDKQVIMSTGMSNLGEIEKALVVLIENGTQRDNITILHCNTEYPTPIKDVNLRAMLTIKEAFPGIQVGYSDHTLGIEVSIASVAMGAKVVEKHFTLDRNLPGPDHRASLEPHELKNLVSAIRNIEQALGDGIKDVSPSEKKNKSIARKSIVTRCEIVKGEIFTEQNLTVKRPGTGISPMNWDDIIGKKAVRNYAEDELI
ncbi:MAG: N-acetylneuraminate synthase [Bacteroidales bacterium]|nr:N-acetylneuraminate synthase [Bacteroidales bacterium]